jgi:rare lipoprotein A
MSPIGCDNYSCVGAGSRLILSGAPEVQSFGVREAFQLFAVVATAATLTACAQSSVVTDKPLSVATSRQTPPESNRKASFAPSRHVAVVAKRHAIESQDASYGLASFYGHESRTASGEKFNAGELTAAHRTLPFGTRVRVTNVATGRSVTVRINDRGPFVPGRIVDVSYSAADTLGIVGRGVAKVKLDVVQ